MCLCEYAAGWYEHTQDGRKHTCIFSKFNVPHLHLGIKANLHHIVVYYLQSESPKATTELHPFELMGEFRHKHWDCYFLTSYVCQRL